MVRSKISAESDVHRYLRSYFDNVRVPKENMLRRRGKGFAVAMKDLDGGRIGVAAQGLGIAKGAYDIAFNI